MKKIACILGSPRANSNSALLAHKVAEAATALGAEAEYFDLYKMDFHDCVACMACKQTTDECALRDDLTGALRAVREADILIMASPVYFGDITGEMKRMVDRMYSLVAPGYLTGGNPTRLEPGKKCLFILTQGYNGEDRFGDIHSRYAAFFGPSFFGYETHVLRGLGLGAPGSAADNAELMTRAEELGKALMG